MNSPLLDLRLGDCMEGMPSIPDGSVDMILADLPYGTTACKWDTVIPLVPLWEQYKRVIKRNGAIVLTASQPFTSALVMSNPAMFRYSWVWLKDKVTGFLNAQSRPMKRTEDVLVFSPSWASAGARDKTMVYYPQGLTALGVVKRNNRGAGGRVVLDTPNIGPNNILNRNSTYVQQHTGYPDNVLTFASDPKPQHPTQKPVALMEYLIRTYTNEGETVLDNTMGSGTTGVACINTGRNFIGIEKDAGYFQIATERIRKAQDAPVQADMGLAG